MSTPEDLRNPHRPIFFPDWDAGNEFASLILHNLNAAFNSEARVVQESLYEEGDESLEGYQWQLPQRKPHHKHVRSVTFFPDISLVRIRGHHLAEVTANKPDHRTEVEELDFRVSRISAERTGVDSAHSHGTVIFVLDTPYPRPGSRLFVHSEGQSAIKGPEKRVGGPKPTEVFDFKQHEGI